MPSSPASSGWGCREPPNLLFDTAWWNPADLLALFAQVPPGQILFGGGNPRADLDLAMLALGTDGSHPRLAEPTSEAASPFPEAAWPIALALRPTVALSLENRALVD